MQHQPGADSLGIAPDRDRPGKGRVEEEVGEIIEPLLNWALFCGDRHARFLGDKFLEIIVRRDAPRLRSRLQPLFYLGF